MNENDFIKYEDDIKLDENEDFRVVTADNIEYNKKYYYNISHFICAFLKYYGKEFDNENKRKSLNSQKFGIISDKKDYKNNGRISVISIQEYEVDIGVKFRIYKNIKSLFAEKYRKIEEEREKTNCSILHALGLDLI